MLQKNGHSNLKWEVIEISFNNYLIYEFMLYKI